ncbi:MAG TPA: hypothetical protein VM779_04140 [Thermoanaerobaculia bacterium]|nr:hypothetical protein [Thermoanaerobaculia bacterium]
MTAMVWALSSLVLFATLGLLAWRLDEVRSMDIAGRVSVALAVGLVVVALVMYVESALGIGWSFATLGVPLVALAAASLSAVRAAVDPPRWPRGAAVAFGAVTAILLYGAGTARMTIGDLLFFWGPKSVHFFHARAIDVEFLRWPHHYLMHPDYPPLVPLVWAASAMLHGGFSYWGAVCSAPLLLAAAALAFRGFAAPVIGARKSALFATLLLAVTGFAAVAGSAAGGAEPFLLLFEIVALSALTFGRGRGAVTIASIALAGAIFTKVEGTAFVISVVLSLLLVKRFRTALVVAVPAAALLGSWIVFAEHHALLDGYTRARRSFHPQRIGYVLYMTAWQVSYRIWYLPWIAALAPLAAGKNFRRAALPFLCGLASIGYSIVFYLTEAEPLWWIQTSAERVMATTLMCLVVASAAASE